MNHYSKLSLRIWTAPLPGHKPLFIQGLAASITLISHPALPQESPTNSLTGPEAIESRRVHLDTLPYTVKSGDFRLLMVPSLGVDWNDNINVSQKSAESDVVVKPFLQCDGSYPVSVNNLLTLSIGAGYHLYVDHPDYGGPRLLTGSQLSYDIYVKDFWINLHDRPKYTQDSAEEAAVANSARYGGLDNVLGATTTWDLRDVVVTLGLDHENVLSSASEWSYVDRASELVNGRAGIHVNPRFTGGLEGSVVLTAYDQPVLNDNIAYSGGLYSDWRPGAHFNVHAEIGYIYYSFQQTSRRVRALDQDSFYTGVTVQHELTDAISYSLSAGHELRLGAQADTIEDTYVRPAVTWKLMRDSAVQAYLSYEHGAQGSAQAGGLAETYDYLGGSFSVSRSITKRLTASLHYRFTFRSSNASFRSYNQDLVGILLTYTFQ